MTIAIDNTLGESLQKSTKSDMNFALSYTDIKMGRLNNLFRQLFEQNKPSVLPFKASAHRTESNQTKLIKSLYKASA